MLIDVQCWVCDGQRMVTSAISSKSKKCGECKGTGILTVEREDTYKGKKR
jgi:DnaJ-class molecular chaperone